MPIVVTLDMMACRVARSALLSGVPSGQALGSGGGPGHWEALAGQRGQAAVPACSSIRYVRSLFPGARDAFEPGTQGTPRPNLALKGFIIKITQRSQLLHVRVGVRLSCCIVSEFCVLAGIDKCLAL